MRRIAALARPEAAETAVLAMLAALPLVAVAERRLIELVFPLLAVPLMAFFAAEGRPREILTAWTQWFRTPLGAAGLATLGWMLLSPLWSLDPRFSAVGAVKVAGLAAAALPLALLLGRIPRDRIFAPLTVALALGGLLMMLENASGGSAHRLLGYGLSGDMQVYRYTNRSWFQDYNIRQQATGATMVAALLLWPCAGWLVLHGRRAGAAGLIALVWVVGSLGTSGAALLGLLTGTAILAVGLWRIRAAVILVFAQIAGSLALAPFLGPVLRQLPVASLQWLAQHHATERIELWTGYMDLWPMEWLTGFGFHAVKLLGSEAKRAVLLPATSTLDAPHPHDLPIQILFEFGLVGAALVVLLAALACIACLRGRSPSRPFAVATAATIWAISLVDYDLWYPWWTSIDTLSLLLAVRLLREDPASVPYGSGALPVRMASSTWSTVMSLRQFRWPNGHSRLKQGRQSSATSRIRARALRGGVTAGLDEP